MKTSVIEVHDMLSVLTVDEVKSGSAGFRVSTAPQ